MTELNREAQAKIDMLEAELAELQADNVVLEERLVDAENQLAMAVGQIIIMKSDCRFDSPVLQ